MTPERDKKLVLEIKIAPETMARANAVVGIMRSEAYQTMTALKKIRFIYSELDKFADSMAKQAVCSKGCAHCCNIPVEVLPIETLHIEHYTGYSKQPKKLRKTPSKAHMDYCPFLDRGKMECKIYEVRPFNCRSFYTFDDPELCRTGAPHYTTGGPKNAFGSPFIFFLAKELIQIELGYIPDLRDNELTVEKAKILMHKLSSRTHDLRYLYGEQPL